MLTLQQVGAEQDRPPCESTGTSSPSCQETETCMVRACHTQEPLLPAVKRRKLAWSGHVTHRNLFCQLSRVRNLLGLGMSHRNLFSQLSRDGNLHGPGMSHAGTSSPNCQETETCMVWACHTGTSSPNCQESETCMVWACHTGTSSPNCQETETCMVLACHTATSSPNCQESETCMVWACHTPRQLLQNHPSGHLGGWTTPRSAEEMQNGLRQRVENPANARSAYEDLLLSVSKLVF